jgi:hypothetical protein
MANARSGNTHSIDATGVLSSDPCKIAMVLVTATAATAILELRDAAGSVVKLNLRAATSGDTAVFDFALNPIFCPNGLKVQTLTNCIAFVVYNQNGGA